MTSFTATQLQHVDLVTQKDGNAAHDDAVNRSIQHSSIVIHHTVPRRISVVADGSAEV